MKLFTAVGRRLRRMRRRKKVGRAYDMALEVARLLPPRADVLDVGCGNGFIAHHLSGLLRSTVVGLDVMGDTAAKINYVSFDGQHFPIQDGRFDAVLLCYVLHHVKDAGLVLREVKRVLRKDGLALIYEDIPRRRWDRGVCWTHDRKWRTRTGPCTFHFDYDWRTVFNSAGFELIMERQLSRWRNLTHPVSRQFYLLSSDRKEERPKSSRIIDHPTKTLAEQVCVAASPNTSPYSFRLVR